LFLNLVSWQSLPIRLGSMAEKFSRLCRDLQTVESASGAPLLKITQIRVSAAERELLVHTYPGGLSGCIHRLPERRAVKGYHDELRTAEQFLVGCTFEVQINLESHPRLGLYFTEVYDGNAYGNFRPEYRE